MICREPSRSRFPHHHSGERNIKVPGIVGSHRLSSFPHNLGGYSGWLATSLFTSSHHVGIAGVPKHVAHVPPLTPVVLNLDATQTGVEEEAEVETAAQV